MPFEGTDSGAAAGVRIGHCHAWLWTLGEPFMPLSPSPFLCARGHRIETAPGSCKKEEGLRVCRALRTV